MNKRLFTGSLALALALAPALAGCGSDDEDKSTAAPPPPIATAPPTAAPTATAAPGAMVALGRTREGRALVDGQGKALYLFEKDKKNASSCTGACAGAWPPFVTTGAPEAGTGIKTELLGSFKRADGAMQVSYAGHPLYHYAMDKAPGDALGQDIEGFGAEWYLVDANGAKVHKRRVY